MLDRMRAFEGIGLTFISVTSVTVWLYFSFERRLYSGYLSLMEMPPGRRINLNSAVAANIASYMILNHTEALSDEDHVIGETEFWRKGISDEEVDGSVAANLYKAVEKCNNTSKAPRRIYIIRHTEKLSKVMPDWDKLAFKDGHYQRVDLNMPVVLPKRPRYPKSIIEDPPISMIGHIQAWLIGYCLQQMGITVSHVYSSPTLRCVETASTLLLGMGIDVKINVEPTLLEWFKWSENIEVMNVDELRHFNINANADYKPFIPYDKIDFNESRLYEYKRCYRLIKSICDTHKDEGGNILIIGHLSTMETIPRLLSGGHPLQYEEFVSRVYEKPFGLMSVLEEDCDKEDVWHRVLPPVQPVTWHARLLWETRELLKLVLT